MEGFRPGVLERLGLSPEECWERNPRLVIARMTGWGQDGPLAQRAGHDINYIALSGALHAIGKNDDAPIIPLNLIGDYAGGGWPLAFGLVSGVYEAGRSGQGQVIDVAMIDGTALLMTPWFGELSRNHFKDERGRNAIDGGSHYYQVYETSDGRFVSLGAMEPQFYARLLELLGLDVSTMPAQLDSTGWAANIEVLRAIFLDKPLQYWVDLFDGEDVCFSPVLSMTDAPNHPHLKARETFVEVGGLVQGAPTPRFSRTPGSVLPVPRTGEHTDVVLGELGYTSDEIGRLREAGAVR
jgi:alpha-methylacyl-CoA racemase